MSTPSASEGMQNTTAFVAQERAIGTRDYCICCSQLEYWIPSLALGVLTRSLPVSAVTLSGKLHRRGAEYGEMAQRIEIRTLHHSEPVLSKQKVFVNLQSNPRTIQQAEFYQ